MANEALTQAILQSLLKVNPPQLRPSPDLNAQISPLVGFVPDGAKSVRWNVAQREGAQLAADAGLPPFYPTQQDSSSRLRLIDAIQRAGSPPHFIGSSNEPTGDRGVTMDVESLVNSLEAQEINAIKSGNKIALDKIRKEKAYWQNELLSGMTAQQWMSQTGEPDVVRLQTRVPLIPAPVNLR